MTDLPLCFTRWGSRMFTWEETPALPCSAFTPVTFLRPALLDIRRVSPRTANNPSRRRAVRSFPRLGTVILSLAVFGYPESIDFARRLRRVLAKWYSPVSDRLRYSVVNVRSISSVSDNFIKIYLLSLKILYHTLDKNAILSYNNNCTDRFSLNWPITIFV